MTTDDIRPWYDVYYATSAGHPPRSNRVGTVTREPRAWDTAPVEPAFVETLVRMVRAHCKSKQRRTYEIVQTYMGNTPVWVVRVRGACKYAVIANGDVVEIV